MKYIKALSGILISVVFLFLSLRQVNLHDALQVIYHVKWGWLVLGVITALCGLIARSYRWRIIIKRKDLPVKNFFEATCVGQMTNNVFPFRAGDLVQAYFLSFREKLGKSLALSTVIIERISDLFPPILILIISSYLVFLPEEINRGKVIAFALVLLVFLVIFFSFNHVILSFVENIFPPGKVKEKLHGFIGQFHAGMSFIKNREILANVVVYTLFLWFIYSMIAYLTLLAFDIEIGYFGALLVCCITAVSVVIPSSPGYIGTWEFFAILALRIFKIDKDVALSFALIYHLVNWVTVTFLGFVLLMRSGFSITNLNQAEDIAGIKRSE